MARNILPTHLRPSYARYRTLWGAAILVLSGLIIYWNSLEAPFVFDDVPAVERNASIREIWPPWQALNPPVDGSGISGRPLTNFSLALNYAFSNLSPSGYRATNLAFHLLASLALWGVLRRTLQRNSVPRANSLCGTGTDFQQGSDHVGATTPGFNFANELFALSVALLWTVHPLQTESVVCVIQRTEILGSLCYLLTLYGFIRAVDRRSEPEPKSRSGKLGAGGLRAAIERWNSSGSIWLSLSVLACLAGVACKEIIVTAPILILLYDRTFVSGTFQGAWKKGRKYYVALFLTWLPLAALVFHNRQRGGTVGFGGHAQPWDYLLTQCHALTIYLKLAVWPHPLVVDYGYALVRDLRDVWWQAIVICTLLAATIATLVRRPIVGFFGASFFLILAPSSSILPLATQTMAEHRMYLPLAIVLGLLMAGLNRLTRRGALVVAFVGVVVLGLVTIQRNQSYRTELELWLDTVANCPGNARAHGNLGRAYLQLGRWEEALVACRQELAVDPSYNGDGRVNLGRALIELGRPAEALPYFEEGLRLRPDSFDVHNNLGIALAALNRTPEAIAHFEAALRLEPSFAEVYYNLANALGRTGRRQEALVNYEAALRLKPDFVEAEVNWGHALAEADRLTEALPHFNAALRLQPENAMSHYALGNVLARLERYSEAIFQFETAIRILPEMAEAQRNLGATLMKLDRADEAAPHFEETVRLMPGSAEAHHELALVLGQIRRWADAARHEEEALRIRPDFAEAREHLAWLRQQ